MEKERVFKFEEGDVLSEEEQKFFSSRRVSRLVKRAYDEGLLPSLEGTQYIGFREELDGLGVQVYLCWENPNKTNKVFGRIRHSLEGKRGSKEWVTCVEERELDNYYCPYKIFKKVGLKIW